MNRHHPRRGNVHVCVGRRQGREKQRDRERKEQNRERERNERVWVLETDKPEFMSRHQLKQSHDLGKLPENV